MQTILVPTDFSKTSVNAVKYAFSYAEKTMSKLIIFNAFNSPMANLKAPPSVYQMVKENKLNAEKRMKKLKATLISKFPNIKVKWISKAGFGSSDIVEYAKKNKISLIIMGTTGEGAIKRKLFGCTTSSVIMNASCSLIVVPPKAKFKGIKRMTVATDFRKDTLLVTNKLISFATQFKAEITFIYVQDLEYFDKSDGTLKIIDKIKSQTQYKNISFLIYAYSNIEYGIDYIIKRNKPDILAMLTRKRKSAEKFGKMRLTNKMSEHLSIPLLVIHNTE